MSFIIVGPTGAFPTVQQGVNAAAHGDTIGVQDATYPEAISWNNKLLRIIGLGSAALLTGAGGGAAPTINVTGTGGALLENLTCSNVGSAHSDVLALNVYQHLCRRVRVNGTGGKICFRAQYLENCVAYNGLNGFVSSCLGENILRHVSVVNMTGQGIICNTANGTIQACLVYGTVGGSIINYNAQVCAWNAAADAILTDPSSLNNVPLGNFAFTNLGAGDVSLTIASQVYFAGISPAVDDFTGKRRMRLDTLVPRIYAGAYDPYPAQPSWNTGVSAIRSF
jgi:hypothetical protein